jgi:predicted AlkP superfamily pyrophosphatase or phosphodiesterase
LIHTDPIDGARHRYGVFNEKVNEAVIETDRYIGLIMEAAREVGVVGETALFLVSDHGQLEIKRSININVLLADYGLIRTDGEGRVSGWDAYCVANGMSATVFLKNREDFVLYRKVQGLLRFLRDEGVYGIGEVYTEEETMSKERLGGDFSFILETDGYTSFGDDWLRPLVKGFDSSDYRHGRATHGYLPEKGPQPFLLAKGPGIRDGAVLENAFLVDEAPTFARVLGLALPDTDGRILEEILEAT